MARIDVDEVLGRLSLADKVDLLAGSDLWHTRALPRHGVPALRLSDGPNGVRGSRFFNGPRAACLPCGTALGATFDAPLLDAAGALLAREAVAKSVHVVLGPTVNVHRSPLGGRGFESFAEDPFLAGLAAAAVVRGIQRAGVAAALKHFVCNDQEHRRMAVQALVTERALREMYALPFQLAVRDARPAAVMTAYNGVNGTMCSENARLIDGLLRREWRWQGLVVSDWFGTYSTTPAVDAGLDLEMPGPPRFRGDLLKSNAAAGKPPVHVIDARAREVLRLVDRCAAAGVDERGPERDCDTPETAALLRRLGNASIVLLKNGRCLLPLSKGRSTLVVGPNAKLATYHGGGSAALPAYYAVTPYDAIAAKLARPPAYAVGAHSHRFLPLLGAQCTAPGDGRPGMRWRVYNEPPGAGPREPVDELLLTTTDMHLFDYSNPRIGDVWWADLEGSLVADDDCTYELGCVVVGTARLFVDGELVVDNATRQVAGEAFFGSATREERGRVQLAKGRSYAVRVEFGSAPTYTLARDGFVAGHGSLRVGGCRAIDDAQAEVDRAVRLAREHDQVVVCAGLSADWESEGADRATMELPGAQDALIAAVAAANASTVVVMQTGTPVEMPWVDAVPAVVQAWYGGNETGNCIADVLFGDHNPSGKLPLTFPRRLQDVPSYLSFGADGGRSLYGEDVYVGYRFYERVGRPVLFPFGHGLSYTTFSFSDLAVTRADGRVSATLTVANTGARAGAAVAQMYVAPPPSSRVGRPAKELRAFAKVHLAPGAAARLTLAELEKYAAAFWDEEREAWCVEGGEYAVVVAGSSAAEPGDAVWGSFVVPATYWWTGI